MLKNWPPLTLSNHQAILPSYENFGVLYRNDLAFGSDEPMSLVDHSKHPHHQVPTTSAALQPTHFYQLPMEKERALRALYKSLDIDGDGKVNIKDLIQSFKTKIHEADPQYAKDFLKQADTSKSNDIDFAEFVHYVLEHEKKLEVVFRSMDLNLDGVIDFNEVKSYFNSLGVSISDAEAKKFVHKMDSDGDTTIELDEFQKYLLFYPKTNPADIVSYWRHGMVIDIGEDGLVPEDFSRKEMQTGVWWRHLVAGGSAGAVSRTCTAPLDRLKVFLQVNASKENSIRVVSGLRYLIAEGGIHSLWRGNGVNVIKIAPESALKFMAYEQMKRLIKNSNDDSEDLKLYERLFAGSCAGAISQTVIYPMEVIKTRFALRKSGQLDRGVAHFLRNLYNTEGLRCFYRGYLPNLIGIIPYAGIDLAVYETLKMQYIARQRDGQGQPGVLALLACGTTSSVCGMLASYPLALVRTRLQARSVSMGTQGQPATMTGQFRQILSTEGATGLYRGLSANCLKVLPAVGISYVIYENVRNRLGATMS